MEKSNIIINDYFSFYLDCIKNEKYFKYLKLNHTFWQFCNNDHEVVDMYKKWPNCIETINDIFYILHNELYIKPNVFLGIGMKGHENLSVLEYNKFSNRIKKHIKQNYFHSALSFKKAFIRKKDFVFFDCLNKYKIVVIGLSHLYNLKKIYNINNFDHICISIDEMKNKIKLLEKIKNKYSDKTVFLFQCGEILSFWLIYNLKDLEKCFCIDMGRSLDLRILKLLDLSDKKILNNILGYNNHKIAEYQPWKYRINWSSKLI